MRTLGPLCQAIFYEGLFREDMTMYSPDDPTDTEARRRGWFYWRAFSPGMPSPDAYTALRDAADPGRTP